MSATSVQTQDITYFKDKFQKELLLQGNKVFMFNSFNVGSKTEYQKILHTLLFEKILCRKNCEIYNFIEDRVMGKDSHCKSLFQGIQEYEHCPREKVIEQACPIKLVQSVEW